MGLTAANLLAAHDVPVILIERNVTTSDAAKAISLDDESLRTMQAAGIAEQVLEVIVPGTGTRYFDRHGRTLLHADGPEPYRHGYGFKNQFAQPEFERVLSDSLKGRKNTTIWFSTELVGIEELGDEGARVQLRRTDPSSAAPDSLTASWILACDGGRSTVRELHGIGMSGDRHEHVWLVVDTLEDHHDERYGMHLGVPSRPTVIVPGRDGRCRYEFLLHVGEGQKGPADFELIRKLVAPYRELRPEQVERATNYTFNALVADTWRQGRSLLLGDAAHMMPPFAGQGLNSGVRDAVNAAWKVSDVWHGRLPEAILDSYEPERKTHSTAMVEFSARLGGVVMTTSRTRAFIRDVTVRAMKMVPAGRRYLTEMRFRPVPRHRSGFVHDAHELTGTLLPQPWVLTPPSLRAVRLDEVLGNGFALVGVDVDDAAWSLFDEWEDLRVPVQRVDAVLRDRLPHLRPDRASMADMDRRLDRALSSAVGAFVLVRPDRYVAAVIDAGDRSAADRVATAMRN